MRPWRQLIFGLRSRILLTFGLGSLALSAFLAFATYNFTRSNLVKERESNVVGQTYDDAAAIGADLRSNPANVQAVVDRLGAQQIGRAHV